ncbi:MAG: molybdate ABC transporter permease subunit [Deltaproteobacteria bacterium]|jgi:molybdate transport system permease protein
MPEGINYFPLVLSFKVATAAILIVTPPALALVYLQARRRYFLRPLVDAVILLPMVLPPSVVGFFLVMAMGRQGPIGRWLEGIFDLRIIFSPFAAVIAAAVVALPILVKTAQPAIESVPLELEEVGRSLGLRSWTLFFRVILPAAWRGILAAIALAYARALGEFGATLMFAGNIPGRTNTMPLEIFSAYQAGDDGRALFYVLCLTAFSLLVVILSSRFSPRPRGQST